MHVSEYGSWVVADSRCLWKTIFIARKIKCQTHLYYICADDEHDDDNKKAKGRNPRTRGERRVRNIKFAGFESAGGAAELHSAHLKRLKRAREKLVRRVLHLVRCRARPRGPLW